MGLHQLSLRKIIHVDADCFFAALEMRDDSSLRNRPMAVGGEPGKRGVISTSNYEARVFGVRSAMASAYAKRLCPDLIIVPHRMLVYREASRAMNDIFRDYTDLVEPLSLDEAFLDVSSSDNCSGSATLIAQEIRKRVSQQLNITVSAGAAPNKFIAKVASDWYKPDGLTVVPPRDVDGFVSQLPVSCINGVGKVTAAKMHRLGIRSCGDLRKYSLLELVEGFGSFGARLYHLCRGQDERPVCPERRRKSLSVEHTYSQDLPSLAACEAQLPDLFGQLSHRLSRVGRHYSILKGFVKVKFDDFSTTTLERMGTAVCLQDYRQLLVEAVNRSARPVRLLGLGVRFREEGAFEQLNLLDELC